MQWQNDLQTLEHMPIWENEYDKSIETIQEMIENRDHLMASTYIYIVHLREQSLRKFIYDELKRYITIEWYLIWDPWWYRLDI